MKELVLSSIQNNHDTTLQMEICFQSMSLIQNGYIDIPMKTTHEITLLTQKLRLRTETYTPEIRW